MDSWTVGLAPVVLIAGGVMAAVIPARKAASVNLVVTLRAE
jgi:ABC-type lipoprotein release transport system permease subunit